MRKLILSLITIAGLAVPLLAAAPAQAASSPVVIREIFYNSPGSDTGSNASLNAEWVQLHNIASHAVTMTNWTLRDKAGHVYTFGTYRIPAHWYLKIHTGPGKDTKWNRFWNHGWYIWNNNGDTATLEGPAGGVKSQCTYSDPSEVNASVMC